VSEDPTESGAVQDVHIWILNWDNGGDSVDVPCIVTSGWNRFSVALPSNSANVDVCVEYDRGVCCTLVSEVIRVLIESLAR
jgi:hypothetical protein